MTTNVLSRAAEANDTAEWPGLSVHDVGFEEFAARENAILASD